jgi:hypothetical protein
LRGFDPQKNFLWDWVPSKGKSGGMLSGLISNKFDVGNTEQGEFILRHYVWDKLLEVKWSIMNVYGPTQEEYRDSFLAELASFYAGTRVPYVIGGDFNIL